MGTASHPWEPEVHRTLAVLGGEGTLGDIVALTGLPGANVERALEALIAGGRGHVRVLESGDVVYHLGECPYHMEGDGRGGDPLWTGRLGFDRKTVQLIRAREGVISLAELVEHTGLSLADAQEEMRRLGRSYGGVPYPSLDGHVVYRFPELMTSAHTGLAAHEPRPAWVRFEDPMRSSHGNARRDAVALGLSVVGIGASLAAPWLMLGASMPALSATAVVAGAGLLVCSRNVLGAIQRHRRFRSRHTPTVRRYLLGLVIQTALAGKGVVSLDRAVRYIAARMREKPVRRDVVERALRELASEFDAPITEIDGELFFGFRNVKRQFLASLLVRRREHLSRTVNGATVFDTADSPVMAAARDLAAFDRALHEGTVVPTDVEKNDDVAAAAD